MCPIEVGLVDFGTFYTEYSRNSNFRYILLVLLYKSLWKIREGAKSANRFQTYINSYNFDFTKKAIEKELSDKDLEYGRFTREDLLGLHVNQIYFYNLAKHVAKKTEKYRKDTNKIKLIYIPENYYTPNYPQHGGGVPEKNSPYYFQMFLTFYLQERGINVSYLVNQQDVKGGLIYRIINVVDHYDVRKNNPDLYPRYCYATRPSAR